MNNPVCLNSNTYHGFALAEAVEGARRAGIHAIELSAVTDWTPHVSPDMSNAEIGDLRDLLQRSDVRPLALGGHSNLTTEEGRERFSRNLGLAERLGVDYVVTGTGETHEDASIVEDEAALASEIAAIARRAAERGLRIGIETHGATYDTGVRVGALVDLIGAPNVGITYDTGNVMFYGGVEPYDDLARSADRVIAFHLKDKAGAFDEWNFPAIGDGYLDLARIAAILDTTGCVAPLSIEIEFTPSGPGPVSAVHAALVRSVAAIAATMSPRGTLGLRGGSPGSPATHTSPGQERTAP